MNNHFQKRKDEDPAQPRGGLGRRATDTSLKGMHVKEDDSDGTWADWEAAVHEAQSMPKPDTASLDEPGNPGPEGPEGTVTRPLPLDPGA